YVRDGLGNQPLTGLARVHVTQGLILRVDIEQPGVAGLAADQRIGDDLLEGREHIRNIRAKGLRRGGNRLVDELRECRADRIRVVERVVVDHDDLAAVAGATKAGEDRRHVGLDARERRRQAGADALCGVWTTRAGGLEKKQIVGTESYGDQ